MTQSQNPPMGQKKRNLEFQFAGLIYGPELHHLDHLAPLCRFMEIPLVVTEQTIAALAERFYPGIQVILCDYLAVAEYLVSHFDIIFYSMPRDLFDEVFFFAQKLIGKRVHTIWCPHGNSDKGHPIFHMEALKKEEAALIYGKQMIDFLKSKGVYDQLKGHVITGNYRHQFYLDHKAFYDPLVEREILRKLPKAKKTILYAPTWRDYENSTSFFDATKPLIETLPAHHNLIVKLHPNLLLQEEFQISDLMEKYEGLNNVLFLTDFPAIYPLLSLIDIYIGDMSSIGYDFLAFNRPMFFLNQNLRDAKTDNGLYLFRCGVEINPEHYPDIHKIIERYFQFELRNFTEIRQEVSAYAFGHPKPLAAVKKEIVHLCSSFPKKTSPFINMRAIAILTGPDTHLDHLGVLSSLLEIPLIVTDETTLHSAQTFYPDSRVELKSLETLSLDWLAHNCDAIFESGKFFSAELGPFLKLLFHKTMRFVFCPHGNSDKGHSLQNHVEQDISLVYGEHLHDLLKNSGAIQKISHLARTGNYRLPYYLRHQKLQDGLANSMVFSRFSHDKPIILYAPTWNGKEDPTSFFAATKQLIEELSPSYNLLIKLHPFLMDDHPAHVFQISARYENHPSVLFLSSFPPIYPLLSRCALYMGDYSSIGYDFLAFDRPLYFLNPCAHASPLRTCGIEIPLGSGESLTQFLDATRDASAQLSDQRKKIYNYAFGEEIPAETLKKEIFKLL